MPDCTGTVVETRAPEVLEKPAGWPAAVAEVSPLAALRVELKESFDAYSTAQKAWDVYPPHEPGSEQDTAYHATMKRHIAAIKAVGGFEPRSVAELAEKAAALQSREADHPEGVVSDLADRLCEDIREVCGQDAEPACPAARLMDAHEPIYAQFIADMDTRPPGQSEGEAAAIHDVMEEQSSWVRARSLRGAMYQLALATSLSDVLMGARDWSGVEHELRCRLDHAALDRLINSAMAALVEHLGADCITPMVHAYAGNVMEEAASLHGEPIAFDARIFVRAFEEAGGKLVTYVDRDGDDRLMITPPRRTGAHLLSEIGEPAKYRMVETYVLARRDAQRCAQRRAH